MGKERRHFGEITVYVALRRGGDYLNRKDRNWDVGVRMVSPTSWRIVVSVDL